MSRPDKSIRSTASRRDFLKLSGGAAAGTALFGAIAARSYAGEDNTIKMALIGCGGRGTGAAAQCTGHQGADEALGRGRLLRRRARSPACTILRGQFAKQLDVAERAAVCRPGRLQEGDRLARSRQRRSPGHAARLPAHPPRIRRGEGHARVHGEVVRRGRPRAFAAC